MAAAAATTAATAVFTRAEVAAHNTDASNWIIIDDKVYDVTKFARFHPGGTAFIRNSAGGAGPTRRPLLCIQLNSCQPSQLWFEVVNTVV